jgi:hypothetical protein
VINGSADYAFNSRSMNVQWANGQFVPEMAKVPTGFTVKKSLIDTITGVSLAAGRVAFYLQANVCVCFGALITSTGLFMGLDSRVVADNNSSAVKVLGGLCKGAAYTQSAVLGLGHRLPPKFVAAYSEEHPDEDELPQSSGVSTGTVKLWEQEQTWPKGLKVCD